MKKNSFFKTPLFWFSLVLLFIGSIFYSLRYYPKAFPQVDIPIQMNREGALQAAQALAKKNLWGPTQFEQAVEFSSDSRAQTFIELAGGGKSMLSSVIQKKLFFPFTWTVRHYQPSTIEETHLFFTPEGDFYGFTQLLPENLAGAALSANAALKIAESEALSRWHLPLSEYQLIEKSSSTQPSQRVDHTFTYERKEIALGEGKLRMRLVVSGDRLSSIRHYIHIPDAFSRKYGEMRSANETITSVASAFMIILYIVGGCIVGNFILAKKRWLIWKHPLLAALWVSGFQVADKLNQLPLAWMRYDTAISKEAFLLNYLISTVVLLGGEILLLTLSFMAAESLSRFAFPNHPQLWKVWQPRNAGTFDILGRTLGGYLSTSLFIAFLVSIYLFGSNYLGWWSPSDLMYQPDALASYFPWLTSIAQSLHAGFWEECLFRAVPLAGAALIGRKLGREKLFISLGMVLQILIFAAAHANYPAQPSYARVIELILPSFFFGMVYLRFGLLPGIILHFSFDTVLFAIPIFTATSPGVWRDQLMILLLMLTPLWLVIMGWVKNRGWKELPQSALHAEWQPLTQSPPQKEPSILPETPELQKNLPWILGVLGVISAGIWFGFLPIKSDTWNLNISRTQAVEIAQTYLKTQNIHLSHPWVAQPILSSGSDSSHEFVWRTSGSESFHSLLGKYIQPPTWNVRWVRFDAETAERAETYIVQITRDGTILSVSHELPEGRLGASLTEDQARPIALKFLKSNSPTAYSQLQEISHSAIQHPKRKDWVFTFKDSSISLKQGDARVMTYISGDQLTADSKYIFIPEEWIRKEKKEKTILSMIHLVCSLGIMAFFLGALILAIIRWTQGEFDPKTFKKVFLLMSALEIMSFLNTLPSRFAQLSTIQPRENQLLSLFLFAGIKILGVALIPAVLSGFIFQKLKIKPNPNTLKWREWGKDWVIGAGLGMMIRTLQSGLDQWFDQRSPLIPNFGALDRALPVFNGIESASQFIWMGIFTLLLYLSITHLTRSATKKLGLGFLFSVAVSLMICGIGTEQISRWLISGVSLSLLIFFTYRWLLRGHPQLIPGLAASLVVLGQLKQLRLSAYPGILPESLVCMLLVGVIGFFWYTHLNGNSQRSRHRP